MPATTSCIVFDCSTMSAPVPVGRFVLDANGDGHFGYGLKYIERSTAFALDPVHLPLSADMQIIPRHKDGSYGILSDAGPNAWGVKLTSSLFRKQGRSLPTNPVEWLLTSWHYGSGCIGFSESLNTLPHPGVAPMSVKDLDARLIEAVEALTSNPDAELDEEAIRLALPGGSLGGVRPKTVVLHDGREYIAKFSRPDDRFDVPAAEYATLRLAHMAGINVPDFELTRIGDKSVLLVERFDRTADGKRLHYMSANTLVNIDSISPDKREYRAGYSYAGIAESMRPLNDQGVADSHELFRRMVLNIMVGNVDDHLRNHALIMKQPGRFVLSPAFDILPHLDAAALPQSIGVGAAGAASTIDNALSQCGRFLLTTQEAHAIAEEVRDVVSQWRTVFNEAGISKTDIHTLSGCFSVLKKAVPES